MRRSTKSLTRRWTRSVIQLVPAPSEERGQIMIMTALAAIIMFAFVGLAVDVGRLYVAKAELSRAVDAAALSGILEFDGTTAGQERGRQVAEAYFNDNEGGDNSNGQAFPVPGENEMIVEATKKVDMYFLSVIGIHDVTVRAHARAGFGTQFLDVVMVLDATPSMAGTPITQAKNAAITFKNILLGNNPQGNVLIGMTPFRGCFNTPRSHSDCISTTNQLSGLSFNSNALNTYINNITASSGGSTSATNTCTGLAKGWDIMSGVVSGQPAHFDDTLYPNNRQYLILLGDGDNAYWGSVSYQNDGTNLVGALAPFSPTGTRVDGNDYPCMPYENCSTPSGMWTNGNRSTPCGDGVNTVMSANNHASDGFDGSSNTSWSSGSGWTGNWIPNTSDTGAVSTPSGSAQGGSRQLLLSAIAGGSTTVASDGFDGSSNTSWSSGSGWIANWQVNNTNTNVNSTPTGSTQSGSRQLRLGRNGTGTSNVGTAYRRVNLSSLDNAELTYWARRSTSFADTDRVFVEVSTNGSSWTTLRTHAGTSGSGLTNTGTSYAQYSVDLSAYTGNNNVHVRFRGSMNNNSDQFFVDTIAITTTNASVTGSIYRAVNLSSTESPDMTYYARRNSSFSGTDRVFVEAATSLSGPWTVLRTHAGGTGSGLTNTTTSYQQFSVDLSSFQGQSTVYIRFRGDMNNTGDQFYVDTVAVRTQTTEESPANGYLNGNDGSSPQTCNEYPTPRERQIDARTIKLAQAIKSQGIEVFVVAFAGGVAGCNLNNSTVYDEKNPDHCNAVNQSQGPAIPGYSSADGPIGDGTHDGTANHRLLKCIASNTPGTLDHYYYASSANELTGIFTQIANQIAHRLIE